MVRVATSATTATPTATAVLVRETTASTPATTANTPSPEPTEHTLHTLTPTQARFWAVLQDEENRNLRVSELCKKAGYRATSSWCDALKDPAFREMVRSLGVIIRSREKPIEGIVPLIDNPDEEWAKDRVDLRRLLADYPKHLNGVDFRLDFSPISNPKLKALVKRYFRARLGFWGASTFSTYLWRVRPFFLGLSSRYPDLESFAPLTRQMIEPLLSSTCWVDTRGGKHSISVHAKRHTVVVLEGMFTYMQRHEWEGAPTRPLIYDEDSPKLPKRRPRPIPDSVLQQLKANLPLLGAYAHIGCHARNLVEILLVTGLRAADALHLPEDCLEYDAAGDPRLRWYNHKMKRDGRPLPVTKEVEQAVHRQRELVKEIPDLFGKHYLFRTKRGLYSFNTFCNHLNELVQRAHIVGEDGALYHFKPHQFRHTVGTQMINNGMGIADVMAYLDHDSAEMTRQYAEISDDTLKQKFKQLVLSGQATGGLALGVLREQIGVNPTMLHFDAM